MFADICKAACLSHSAREQPGRGASSPGGVCPEFARTSNNSRTLSLGCLNRITRCMSAKVTYVAQLVLMSCENLRDPTRVFLVFLLVCLTLILTEHRAVAVRDRLSLHRQLHLDAGLSLGVEDGHAHALLHARPEHGGRSHQIAPGAKPRGRKHKKGELWRR